jgi:transcriptional regulator with XRE-family HTH domain
MQASGLTHVQIANKSGVTTNTLRNWFGGPTKRPQHATIAAVISVLGYHVVFVKKGESNVVPIHKQSHRT